MENNNSLLKVKNIVKDNFNKSFEVYKLFEKKYNFFYNLTNYLANFSELNPNDTILDAGCGCGYSTKAIYDNYSKNVYGIDISEKMIELGKKLFPYLKFYNNDLLEMDKIFEKNFFDAIIFNLVVFIIPDIEKVFEKSYNLLKSNGKLSFSYYPEIVDNSGNNLFEIAFEESKLPKPKKQVVTEYKKCIESLKKIGFKNIKESFYAMDLSIEFLIDFFSIPAQSASLFPKIDYSERKENIKKLFNSIKNYDGKGKIKWKLAKAMK